MTPVPLECLRKDTFAILSLPKRCVYLFERQSDGGSVTNWRDEGEKKRKGRKKQGR